MANLQQLDTYFTEHRTQHLQEIKDFLRIPSISSLSEHKADMTSAANFLAQALTDVKMENVAVLPTNGHPVVYGEWLHAKDKPTVLFYGHYDVQPVDPLNLWDSAPFEPTIRDNKLFARGASDDKGQVYMHIKTVEALLAIDGELPVNIKFLIEGEEEIGSPSLTAFIEENKDKLASDLIVISDTGLYAPGKPAICYGLRGLTGVQIDVRGAKGDLHSGLYGGGVQNAIHALTEILASFRDEHGTIQVEGFYDNVLPLTEEERAAFDALAQNIVVQANAFETVPGVFLQGKLILGEAIADIGGLQLALEALYASDDVHELFVNFARCECGSATKERLIQLAKIDPHPPSPFRVNCVVSHVDDFYEAYEVKDTDKLFVEKSKRAQIW